MAFVDPGVGKSEVLNLSTMGGRSCWVILRDPVEVRGVTGRLREVSVVKLSPDRLGDFAKSVEQLVLEAR